MFAFEQDCKIKLMKPAFQPIRRPTPESPAFLPSTLRSRRPAQKAAQAPYLHVEAVEKPLGKILKNFRTKTTLQDALELIVSIRGRVEVPPYSPVTLLVWVFLQSR